MSVNLRAREWSIEDLENSELSKKMDKKKKKVAIEFPHKKIHGLQFTGRIDVLCIEESRSA